MDLNTCCRIGLYPSIDVWAHHVMEAHGKEALNAYLDAMNDNDNAKGEGEGVASPSKDGVPGAHADDDLAKVSAEVAKEGLQADLVHAGRNDLPLPHGADKLDILGAQAALEAGNKDHAGINLGAVGAEASHLHGGVDLSILGAEAAKSLEKTLMMAAHKISPDMLATAINKATMEAAKAIRNSMHESANEASRKAGQKGGEDDAIKLPEEYYADRTGKAEDDAEKTSKAEDGADNNNKAELADKAFIVSAKAGLTGDDNKRKEEQGAEIRQLREKKRKANQDQEAENDKARFDAYWGFWEEQEAAAEAKEQEVKENDEEEEKEDETSSSSDHGSKESYDMDKSDPEDGGDSGAVIYLADDMHSP